MCVCVCVARFKMAHFKLYEGGQKQRFLSVCVVVHFTCFLGGPANGIKRVVANQKPLTVHSLMFFRKYEWHSKCNESLQNCLRYLEKKGSNLCSFCDV